MSGCSFIADTCASSFLLAAPRGPTCAVLPTATWASPKIYAAGWEAHLLAGISDPPTVLAKALESCPRCPSACLDFHSWRAGMETHAFGRAPLPEFKIGAEPVRVVETHDLDDAKVSDIQLQRWLQGIPTGSDQTTVLDDCLRHSCDFLEVWGAQAGLRTQAVA